MFNFFAELKDQMLEKETELSSAKKELTELEQYQVGLKSCITRASHVETPRAL
jgi:hypothetical protein